MMQNKTVAVLGLGYVGLPLALGFGRKMRTIGFDLSKPKVQAYIEGFDPTGEQEKEKFKAANQIEYTTDPSRLKEADFIVVAVPTPIDNAKRPDLSPVEGASMMVGKNLKKGAVVIYESTFYPGVTEDFCVPIIEKHSGMKWKKDFKIGYSPERINPGDKEHTLERIVKVVSGEDAETLEAVAQLYSQVVEAGVFRASSIKVAEAAKVIENTQRDLNIALMNELAIIFHKLDIDTIDVIKTASTKWNFLPFKPGLVGGHCIGVDPYYLTFRAEQLGYLPQVILAGRRINDEMGAYVATNTVKEMIASGSGIKGARVLVTGLTFKENCPDLRNSKVIDIIRELKTYGLEVVIWDPLANDHEAMEEYGVNLTKFSEVGKVDAIVAAVAHKQVVSTPLSEFQRISKPGIPFIDVKCAFDRQELIKAGFRVWRL
jgi:UDP-N-acetyl-D-galactosamine dehydrogenase